MTFSAARREGWNEMKMHARLLLAATLFCTIALQAQEAAPWLIGPFTRPATGNPVVMPRPGSTFIDPVLKAPAHWEALHTFNPAAIVRDNKVYVLDRAEDNSGQMKIGGPASRLEMAESADGIHFKRRPEPVFFPAEDSQKSAEWPGGVEDPRIVESDDGAYVMTYTQWNGKIASIGIATSPDLLHWTKPGPAFQSASGGKYAKIWCKSAGIVLLKPRPRHFDSTFPESGPPPLLTDAGIVLIYNGKNAPTGGDPELGPNAYGAGEVLFDAHNPAHLLEQTDKPVLKPELPYEKTGQYTAGTTFAEGLV